MDNTKYHLASPTNPRAFWTFAVLPSGKVLVENRGSSCYRYRWELDAAEARLRWVKLVRQGWVRW